MSFEMSKEAITESFTVPNTDFTTTLLSIVVGVGEPFTSARRVSESILRRRLRLDVGVKARTPRIQGMVRRRNLVKGGESSRCNIP